MPGKRKPTAPAGAALPEFRRIPLDRIVEPELAARAQMSDLKMRELIDSMRELGQLEPISVEQHDAMYEIVTGHRRFLAARELKWSEIGAMVYAEGAAQRAAMMVHENVIREELNPAEEALFMAQVRERMSLDEAGLMKTFHRSADYIANRFALLRGDAEIFAALQRGEIRLGVAHELNRITAADMRRYYLDCARRGDPPARVVHQWVEDWRLQSRGAALFGHEGAPAASHAEGASASAPEPGAEAGADGPAIPPAPAKGGYCELCGGHRDPHNLICVFLHKWHWDDITAAVERAAKGAES